MGCGYHRLREDQRLLIGVIRKGQLRRSIFQKKIAYQCPGINQFSDCFTAGYRRLADNKGSFALRFSFHAPVAHNWQTSERSKLYFRSRMKMDNLMSKLASGTHSKMEALQTELWRQACPTHKMNQLAKRNAAARLLTLPGLPIFSFLAALTLYRQYALVQFHFVR